MEPVDSTFSAHFKTIWAPLTNVDWVKAGTEMGLVHVAHLCPT